MPSFYEFFAGGGMARAGLGEAWHCLFANDFDARKAAVYRAHWGDTDLRCADIASVVAGELPGRADLAWASFPCQDLSLAGAGAGLGGGRSGTFWSFMRLIEELGAEQRAPAMIVLENVCGALTSRGGQDFSLIGEALVEAGYRFGAVVVDAVHFVPQSRPRLFILAVKRSRPLPSGVTGQAPEAGWSPPALREACSKLSARAARALIWWRLPIPPVRCSRFADLVEEDPQGVEWHSPAETQKLLGMMSPANLAKVAAARRSGARQIGAVYKRTRPSGLGDGQKLQRAEVRFDDVAGCLRTPSGGSSRQTLLWVEGERKRIRSRLLSPREAARLMGLPDSYLLPLKYNDAYHLAGDGVVVPVVRFLAEHLIEPVLAFGGEAARKAA